MKLLLNKYDLIREICMHEKESSESNQINVLLWDAMNFYLHIRHFLRDNAILKSHRYMFARIMHYILLPMNQLYSMNIILDYTCQFYQPLCF